MSHTWFSDLTGFGRSLEHVSILSDNAGWSLSEDARHLRWIVEQAGMKSVPFRGLWACQHVFCTDRYKALKLLKLYPWPRARLSIPYYHGYPGEGDRIFDSLYEKVLAAKDTLYRIQVTHERMRTILLEGGIPSEKLVTIPIGIDCTAFTPKSAETACAAREEFGIPREAVVIGSFQKDGNGWEEGLTPKMVKGPDILCDALAILRRDVPELFVLLSGPARGYVKERLTALGIPFSHQVFSEAAQLSRCYHAVDAYVVSSRQEGGPKAVLESMASGVPLVSTSVGQATELVRHGWNGLLADGFTGEELAAHVARVLGDSDLRREMVKNGLQTAEANSYAAQVPVWKAFFGKEERV